MLDKKFSGNSMSSGKDIVDLDQADANLVCLKTEMDLFPTVY